MVDAMNILDLAPEELIAMVTWEARSVRSCLVIMQQKSKIGNSSLPTRSDQVDV
jgi:hypothetical protein